MLQYQTIENATLGLLKRLMGKDYLQQFTLVGGTALALQMGHRKSVDLDLFTLADYEAEHVHDLISEDFSITKSIARMKQTLIVEIEDIKVDFIRFRHPCLGPLVEEDGIRMYSVEDIAAEIRCNGCEGCKKRFLRHLFLASTIFTRTTPRLIQEKIFGGYGFSRHQKSYLL